MADHRVGHGLIGQPLPGRAFGQGLGLWGQKSSPSPGVTRRIGVGEREGRLEGGGLERKGEKRTSLFPRRWHSRGPRALQTR